LFLIWLGYVTLTEAFCTENDNYVIPMTVLLGNLYIFQAGVPKV